MTFRLPTSIRYRTLLLVLTFLALISSLIGIASFRDAQHEIEEIFDARLAQSARILQALVLGIHEANLSLKDETALQSAFENALLTEASNNNGGHKYEGKIAFQVWHGDTMIMRSRNSPTAHLADHAIGFGEISYDGYRWLTFNLKTLSNTQPFTVTVAEREDVRGELVSKVVLQTLVPDLLGIPVMALLMWWAIGCGLKPLRTLTQKIQHQAPENLQPIQLDTPPDELRPIIDALNRLLTETEAMIAREQRFIADAAHELRTPLAVMKIHADNALHCNSEQEKRDALEHLNQGVDRSTRIISQLLTLARLDPDTGKSIRETQDLLQETRNQLAALAPYAWTKSIELELNADEQFCWRYPMEEGALGTLLQNLITNAVKFSPESSLVTVSWQHTETSLILQIRDQGTGMNIEQLQRATERFYRHGYESGAGLGLSIVQRITERHHGKIQLSTVPTGGLIVTLTFPLIKQSAR